MLNVPVAFFAQPLYRLVHENTNKRELVALLLGSVILWSYIGWRLDTIESAPRSRTTLRISAAVLGCLFALFVLIQTITMFHVGFLYKVIAVFWSLLIFRHFALFLRTSPASSQTSRSPIGGRMPGVALNTMAICWTVFLVVGAVALPPLDSPGRPDIALTHVFAICGALLLLATGYAMLVYLLNAWRSVREVLDRADQLPWVGLDTCLAVGGVAAIVSAAVHG